MTTLAHSEMWYVAREWEKLYASAVLSGIVGNLVHQVNGGYHISIEDNSSTNHSVTRPDDKAPPGDWPRNLAAAIDMSMNPTDMATCSSRLWNIWNDKTDPRRIYLNGFNGWFNDGGPAKRYDYVSQGISTSTSDHKWHVHKERRRRWVTWRIASDAILSALRGETKEQYLDSLQGGDDMWCKKTDKNDNVGDLQNRLVEVGIPVGPDGEPIDPNNIYARCDKVYGSWTSRAVASLQAVPNDTGEAFGSDQNKALRALERAKAAGGAGGLVPHTHPISSLPVSIMVSGSGSGTATGTTGGAVQ